MIDVNVYEPDGVTLITTTPVPRRRAVTWRDEHNTPGTGSFEIHLDDAVFTDHPTLLAGRNIVVFSDGSGEVKRWEIEAWDEVEIGEGEAADRWVKVSGRGVLARFERGVVYPAILSQATASEDRAFNFASPDPIADWGVTADWVAPLGVTQAADPTVRSGYPKPWTDHLAQWLWSTDPTTSAALGDEWFRHDFTLLANAEVLILVSADNRSEWWLDGERIILTDTWRQSFQHSRVLVAGDHVLAARVTNDGGATGANNPGGCLFSIYTADATGNPDTFISRSTPSSTLVRPYGAAPGWSFGDIVRKLLAEAQARGATDLDHFAVGFSAGVDSNGDPWADVQDTTLRVGTDLLKVVTQGTELAFDVWTDGMSVEAAPRRGTDRTGSVAFTPGVDCLASAPTFRNGALHNVALIRWGVYWLVVEDAGSITEHGRREVFLQLGTAGSIDQATSVAEANFAESAQPEITVPLQTSSLVGPQPYVDFWVGDLITGPGLFGAATSVRVYALTGTEDSDTDEVTFDFDLYPETWA